MSGDIELNISESTLEHLHCAICKGYLSSSPIRLTSDGDNICGRCSPLNRDTPAYRQSSLEAVMGDATFPCKYNENGCTERLSFDYTFQHESECEFRPSTSMELAQPGSSSTAQNNESTNQDDEVAKQTFVLEDAELRVRVNGDEKTFVVTQNNGCRVINPFNLRNSDNRTPSVSGSHVKTSFSESSRSRRNSNASADFERGSTRRDWDRNYTSFNDADNYHHRNWNSHHPYSGGQNNYGESRRWMYNRRTRRNNLVIIKGRTLYVTL